MLPSIAACFLIRFDAKIGYTITWKRQIPGLEIEGAVEYNSLPSGLHNVKEDLVYFIHEQYAGLSAFAQEPATVLERNVRFVAVGLLVPLDGRFGRGWLHAEGLKHLSSRLLQDISDTSPLEEFWEEHRFKGDEKETTALSESIALPASSDQELSSYHPILSLPTFLDEFGPLIFPIYRMALLRNRLLLLKKPPMRISCEYVYILSMISSVPPTLAESLHHVSLMRSLPLFTISIHDIPMLEKMALYTNEDEDADARDLDASPARAEISCGKTGWIACSSDEVLSTKTALSDTRIIIRNADFSTAGKKQWPLIHDSSNRPIKATQRDVRRYKALRRGLSYVKKHAGVLSQGPDREGDESDATLFRADTQPFEIDIPCESSVVEQQSWAAAAYDSYMWWASAGERSVDLQEELEQDADLLFTAADVWDDAEAYTRRYDPQTKFSGALEMALVAYFHRLTTSIIETLIRLIEATDAAAIDEIGSENRVFVSKDDLICMGVDPWSSDDRVWVVDMAKTYFGREVDVQGASIECCGVKIY